MSRMRLLPVLVILLIVCCLWASKIEFNQSPASKDSVEGVEEDAWNASLYNEENGRFDAESTGGAEWVEPVIPASVQRLLKYPDWSADTICVVDGNAFYLANDLYYRTRVIYDKDRVIAMNPTLRIDSFAHGCKEKFYVSVVGKRQVVDFSNEKSVAGLASLSSVLPSFRRFRNDSVAGFGNIVLYSFAVDFPERSVTNGADIRKWLLRLIGRSLPKKVENADSNLRNGNSERPHSKRTYYGSIYDNRHISLFAGSAYYDIVKAEFGTNKDDYPYALFLDLNLEAKVYNDRFITYQQYTHHYNGGMHGYYTERLVSFDYVHKQEIGCDYLFKPESLEMVKALLLEVAKESPQYAMWNPDIEDFIANKDEEGNLTGGFTLPDVGLSEKGVVFSFQPYDISGYAAGAFHFTIPYEKLVPYLTEQAKWCLYIK